MSRDTGGYGLCKHCRSVFAKKNASQRFCSDDCREQYYLIQKENLRHVEKARYSIFERDDFKCVYCGKSSIEDGVVLCIDHIEPYSVRMNNNVYNLITSCSQCNISKGPYSLRRDVYDRIIARNKKRTNEKMSEDAKSFVNVLLELHFNKQKK